MLSEFAGKSEMYIEREREREREILADLNVDGRIMLRLIFMPDKRFVLFFG